MDDIVNEGPAGDGGGAASTLGLILDGGLARRMGGADKGLVLLADDPQDFAGPLAGVLAGLEHCGRLGAAMTHVATLPADAPFAPHDFVARLHEARRASGAAIAVAASGGRMHPVAALWPVALASDLRRALAQEGLRKVEAFAARFPLALAEWPCEPVDPFFNVNSPADLARAEALLGAAGGA
jgi:molybdenum cofactor guanylyltransferase